MPLTQYFTYIYISPDNVNFFKAALGWASDVDDGGGDDLNVGGDIPDDHLSNGLIYYGLTVDGELVAYGSGYRVIYTDVDHGENWVPTYTDGGAYTFVCYTPGSFIGTPEGEVPVERLSVGSDVLSACGQAKTVKWVGSRTLDLRAMHLRSAQPIMIRAGAFGEGLPNADLRVSPDHAMAMTVDGAEVLIPARMLVNGATIVRDDVDEVTYWHVELEGGHDLLVANGVPSESYLDAGNRGFFAGEIDVLPNDTTANDVTYCRPVADQDQIGAVRDRLNARAEALGFIPDRSPRLTLAADGVGVDIVVGRAAVTARFPAETRELVLLTDVVRPSELAGRDSRRLGLAVHSLIITDEQGTARDIPLGDARLQPGLLPADGGGSRWTRRSLTLPASLWDGMTGTLSMRLGFASPTIRRWIAQPSAAA